MTVHLHRYFEQLKSQGSNAKFLFPSSRLQGFKADHKSVRLEKVNEATSYDNALPYHVGLKTRDDWYIIPEPMKNKNINF